MSDKLASKTTVVQAPVADLLQPFCRDDGTRVWRASLPGGCGEQWYAVNEEGVLSIACRPSNLVGSCEQVRYLGPTLLCDAADSIGQRRLLRYTCALAGVAEPIALLYIDESTGAVADGVDANALVVCEAATEACDAAAMSAPSSPATALIVTQCDRPLEMVRSECVFDQTLNETLVCETWVDPNAPDPAASRFFRYFTLGTEQEVTEQVTRATLCKCEPCANAQPILPLFLQAQVYLPLNFIDTPSASLTPDLSGNSRNGTLQGALAAGNPVVGKVKNAIQFTGNAADIVGIAGYQGVTGTQARTVAAWIRVSGVSVDEAITEWGADIAGQKWTFRVQTSNGVPNTIRIEVNGGYVVGSTPVNDGEWHHAAAVLDPGSVSGAGNTNVLDVRLYVDGALEVQSDSLGQAINTAAGVNVRLGIDFSNRVWTGAIDEFAIWDRALTNAEILQLASA